MGEDSSAGCLRLRGGRARLRGRPAPRPVPRARLRPAPRAPRPAPRAPRPPLLTVHGRIPAADSGFADWLEHIADVETLPTKTVPAPSARSTERRPQNDNLQLRGGGAVGGPGLAVPATPKTASAPRSGTDTDARQDAALPHCCASAEDSASQALSSKNIDLASIRAVYKEEVASTTALDGLVAPSSGASSRIEREALGGGLDGFVLKDVLAPGECEALIKATEGMGFSFWNPASERRDYRNADTVEVTHQELADALWLRVKAHVVPEVTIVPDTPRYSKELEGRWVAVGMNPNMLFNRYFAGGHFSPHTDGYTVLDFNTRSMYSALVYLNDCPVGGATRMMEESGDALTDHVQEEFVLDEAGRHRFRDSRIRASVSPRAGHALFFFQDTLHEGEPVGEGACVRVWHTTHTHTHTRKRWLVSEGVVSVIACLNA